MLYHGTSLVVKGKGILLRGKPGAGKSDLALRLIHQGATLIADDQTEVSQQGNGLIMTAPKALGGKIEVRGIGIMEMDFCPEHSLDILIDLKPWQDIERLPENTEEILEGGSLFRYDIDPFETSSVEKVLTLCQFNVLPT